MNGNTGNPNDNPWRPTALKVRDSAHDAQLLRDVAAINAATVARWGPLPAGGLPAMPRRKPKLPRSAMPIDSAQAAPCEDTPKPEENPMKLHAAVAAAALPLALAATGCNPMANPKNPAKNPHPRQAYEISVTIADAPGPFESVTAHANYRVANAPDCVPQDPFTGVHPAPGYEEPIALVRTGDNSYQGQLYLDLLRNQNYYLKGDCHWELSGFGMAMVANDITFRTFMAPNDISSQMTVVQYQQKRLYSDAHARGMDFASESMYGEIASNRGAYFSITIAARGLSHEP